MCLPWKSKLFVEALYSFEIKRKDIAPTLRVWYTWFCIYTINSSLLFFSEKEASLRFLVRNLLITTKKAFSWFSFCVYWMLPYSSTFPNSKYIKIFGEYLTSKLCPYSIREINIYRNKFSPLSSFLKSFAEMFLLYDAFGVFSIFYFFFFFHCLSTMKISIYVNVTHPITVMLLPLVPKKREKVSAIRMWARWRNEKGGEWKYCKVGRA